MKTGFEKAAELLAALLGKQTGSAVCFRPDENYDKYLRATSPDETELQAQREKTREDEELPLISVLAPDGVPELSAQTYINYEPVCGAPRGEYVLLTGARDILAPDALYTLVRAAMRAEADFIYADEDRLEDGKRTGARFKPDYSAVTLLSYNYIGRPVLLKRTLYEQSGGLKGTKPADEYDLLLRCAELCIHPLHIPRVLLTRTLEPPIEAPAAAIEAIDAHIADAGYAVRGICEGTYRVRIGIGRPHVGIVIPNRNHQQALMTLLEHIDDNSVYKNYSFIIADYGTTDSRTLKYYDLLQKNKAANIVRLNDYNYSRLCNLGAYTAGADALLFLDRDITVLSADWLVSMLEQVKRGMAGAVGPKLLDGSGRLYSTGEVIGLCGGVDSPYRAQPDDAQDERKNTFSNTLRAVSAVSGKCLMVDADVFFSAGAFDESFKVDGAATELCLRLMRRGYTNIYTPYAVVKYHGGSLPPAPERDKTRMYDTMRPMLVEGDPNFNPAYDYADIIPKCAAQPYMPLELFEK